MCHTQNGPAFPLETYEQTWVQARKIRAEVIARRMPPWSAFPGYSEFLNDNSLTLREVQFMNSWVEGSGPRNAGRVFTNTADPSASRRAETRAQADFGHWQLGNPDLTRQLPSTTIESRQSETVKRVVVDLGNTTQRRLRGLEYMPGDRRMVRAAFFTIQETGQWVGNWTPWYGFMSLPHGTAWVLPARAHLVAEIDYRSTTETAVDQGTLGLFFADETATESITDVVLEAKGEILPATAQQKLRASKRLSAGIYVLAMRPEFDSGVQSIEVAARKPNGTTEMMLFARNLRGDWPTPYILKNPVALPAGSELVATAYYGNPRSVPETAGIRVTLSAYQNSGSKQLSSYGSK